MNIVIIILLLCIWWDLTVSFHELKEDINHNKKNNIEYRKTIINEDRR